MGYFSDSRRNWVGAFWAATAIPLVLDPWNLIWDESGWLEEQFGAPFAPLGPSGGNDYFAPSFWAGRSSETVGRRGPRTSPKVSPITRGTCGVQSSNLILQKNLPWTPPPPPLKGSIPLVFISFKHPLPSWWIMFGTLLLCTRAQTEMYPSCFALVIILKFYPCRDRIRIFCPTGVGCKAHIKTSGIDPRYDICYFSDNFLFCTSSYPRKWLHPVFPPMPEGQKIVILYR